MLETVGVRAYSGSVSVGAAFVVVVMLHVMIGEIAPKILATRRAEETARYVAWPLEVLRILLSPLVGLLNFFHDHIFRRLGAGSARGDELIYAPTYPRRLVAHATEIRSLPREDTHLLKNGRTPA